MDKATGRPARRALGRFQPRVGFTPDPQPALCGQRAFLMAPHRHGVRPWHCAHDISPRSGGRGHHAEGPHREASTRVQVQSCARPGQLQRMQMGLAAPTDHAAGPLTPGRQSRSSTMRSSPVLTSWCALRLAGVRVRQGLRPASVDPDAGRVPAVPGGAARPPRRDRAAADGVRRRLALAISCDALDSVPHRTEEG